MNSSEPEGAGRILCPRQFVPLPEVMAEAVRLTRLSGGYDWSTNFPHPEIADLALRLQFLALNVALSDAEHEKVSVVEAVLNIARDYYAFWFERVDVETLLPDALERPEPDAIKGITPSWDNFFLVLGAVHRCRAWVEAVERKYRLNQPTAASAIDAAYGRSAR